MFCDEMIIRFYRQRKNHRLREGETGTARGLTARAALGEPTTEWNIFLSASETSEGGRGKSMMRSFFFPFHFPTAAVESAAMDISWVHFFYCLVARLPKTSNA